MGGIVEYSAKLPGDPHKGGLWPARELKAVNTLFEYTKPLLTISLSLSLSSQTQLTVVWMLGNLARATYVGSTDYIWPFSYNTCDERTRLSQEINACSKVNHFGLEPYRGRGSPEIDIIEAMQGDAGKLPYTHIQRPYQSASLQIAPGIEIDRPVLMHRPHKVCAVKRWFYSLTQSISHSERFFFRRVTGTHL